uniref:3'-5' exonuclease domain-containing protein n=1 Tax=Panagrellus redivivus TaxID=6233 RepID=A0A7E4UZH5_PANRE
MSAVKRTVIIDAMSIMHEINTVIDELFEKDDDLPDAVYLPTAAKFFVNLNANVRIYITKEEFDNRYQYRNPEILEKLLQIGLLYIEDKSTHHYYWDLLTNAEFHATFLMVNYDYENFPGMYKKTIEKYVIPFMSFKRENWNREIVKKRLRFQYSIMMDINLKELSVNPTNVDYQKCISALVKHPNVSNDQYVALDDLLELIHVKIRIWMFNDDD